MGSARDSVMTVVAEHGRPLAGRELRTPGRSRHNRHVGELAVVFAGHLPKIGNQVACVAVNGGSGGQVCAAGIDDNRAIVLPRWRLPDDRDISMNR